MADEADVDSDAEIHSVGEDVSLAAPLVCHPEIHHEKKNMKFRYLGMVTYGGSTSD